MAKAIFHRHQRVYVEPVGTWAVIEVVKPVWVAGFDEPIRVTYDCGLGRDFRAEELTAETEIESTPGEAPRNTPWRLMRARNRVQATEECAHHPYPGTYPVIVTDPNDWGGWRTPGAEYDRDPHRIERQARLIASAPRYQAIAKELMALVAEAPDDAPPAILELAKQAAAIERFIAEVPSPGAAADDESTAVA